VFLILGLLMLIFNDFARSDPGFGCGNASAVANFTSGFAMVQHQVRGVFTVVDDCSFRVSEFDMLLSGGSDVRWWGSAGDDFQSLLAGFVISDSALNHTYRNDTFLVRLRDNATWDRIKVVAVWDIPSASDFGHVLLSNDSEVNSSKLEPPLSVLDNCMPLSDTFRLWWSFNNGDDSIDVALEAAIPMEHYMSFGWADPNAASGSLMVGSDVVITGFDSDQMPFAHDYFITQMTECTTNEDGSVQGVCPDMAYNTSSGSTGLVNDTSLIYGHRSDGVSFIRYRRPLQSNDEKYDLRIDPRSNMSVIWATGPIKPPDSLQPSYLPQNHGTNFGYLRLNVSQRRNDCLGPIDASDDKEDQDLVIADKKEPLVVSSGPALRYPNPPNPSKVLYINKKEAPLLRVERGVPVKFSIQAGHDVALYITSDPVGGNATLRNGSETIYFGGPEAEGVPASPTELVWAPDRNTPDLVYYQSLFTPKMGWKVQVVDGGLPDMYNNSVSLDDQQVMFFWTLSENSISIAARGEKKSGYLAIGFGRGMVNSYVYVGHVDESGRGKVSTYWIDGRDASGIHPTQENLTYVRCRSENGIITLEFTRPLSAACDAKGKPECGNIIDPSTPLRVIWAMGSLWSWSSSDGLTARNMHFMTSKRPMSVLLMRGSAEAEEDLRPVLAVHGFMMFLAWGILLPGGILSARYLKHVKDDSWFRIHVYLQYSGLTIVFLGFLFAVAELRGLVFDSFHVKLGLLAITLAASQPLNAYFRPKKPAIGEPPSSGRLAWEYAHVVTGRCGMAVGVAAVFSGMKHLGDRYRDGNVHGLSWALIVWFLLAGLFVVYMEYRDKNRKRGAAVLFGRSNWVLGDDDDDDGDEEEEDADLLSGRRRIDKVTESTNGRMEVQLEPLSR
ncbi:hypothetical protein M569_10439, partial [Genlisea aurea]